ncbi:MAG: response regulator [Desulfovibrio sp.]|nr:MAG: response regulator [Desulfovibrio sp.]
METSNLKQVVIISKTKKHVDRDKLAIKGLPLRLAQTFDAGGTAFGHLAQHPCDIIVLDSDLSDMDGKTFLKTIKNNSSLKHIPVVMVTVRNERNEVLDAVAAGCSGYIIRPYNDETFAGHLKTAIQLVRFNEIEMGQLADAKLMLELGHFEDAIEEFEEVVSAGQEEALKYYDLGCRYLVKEKYGKAIVSFQKAVKMNDMYAEAYQGLAEAHKGAGDIDQCQFYLKKAAVIYAESDSMDKVKGLFIEILKYDHTAANPFNSLGVKLRKTGDFEGAIRAYNQALELTPSDENIYYNKAKALYFLEDRENCRQNLSLALTINSDFTEARKMYKKLTGTSWPRSNADKSATAKDVSGEGTEAKASGPSREKAIKDV